MGRFLPGGKQCLIYLAAFTLSFSYVFLFNTVQAQPKLLRCATVEDLNYRIQNDPLYLRTIQENQKRIAAGSANIGLFSNERVYACQPFTDTVVVPVVVHVVGPATMQSLVTDAVVQSQIDVLNTDYQGQAPNLALTPAHFQPIFGTSKLKFVLAKRNQYDEPYNGINRRTTSATYSQSSFEDVKQTLTGGDDALDPLRFLNIWVVTFTDNLLGISVFPGDPRPIKLHGFVCEYRAFGKGYPHLYADYGGGRTTTHELGHYFNLFHNWGDDVSGAYGCPGTPACASSDFRANSMVSLPPGTDDTPNQCGATGSVANSTAVITDPCSATAPGINYQNFMDYTIDRGLSMFTKGQLQRVLDCFQSPDRGPLLCSDGYVAPPIRSIDAAIRTIVSPDSSAPSCNTTISPTVVLRNSGTTTLNNVTINVFLDGVLKYTQPYNGALTQYTDVPLTLNPFTTTLGVHQLMIYTSNPNSTTDEYNQNDTLKMKFTLALSVPGPIVEGFESAVFPPAGWKLINPNASSVTWQRTSFARNSGVASAYMNLYNYPDQNHLDYLVSPNMDVTNADSIIVSFARSYKLYDAVSAGLMDTLMLQVSTDCGTTFPITAWKKGGSQLATVVGSTGDQNWFPIAPEWKTERIDLKPFVGNATRVSIAFVVKNRYGQNIFLDDIRMSKTLLPQIDAGVVSVTDPFNRLCSHSFKPEIVIKNFAHDTIKSVTVNISVDGSPIKSRIWTGSLTLGQTISYLYDSTITFATAGNHTFRVYTSQPNNVADINAANDEVNVNSTVFDPVELPLKEGFESGSFPPANWAADNSNPLYKWDTVSNSKNASFNNMVFTEGRYAAWFWNRSFNGNGAKDDLYSPLLKAGNPDSIFLKFDVANVAAAYPGSTTIPLDTLEVLMTKDCGKTFVSVYKKWGGELQTILTPNPGGNAGDPQGFIPNAQYMWRTEKIDLTNIVTANSTFQLVFRNTNNNGNNTFLDNILVNPLTLPAKLKRDGFLVWPNPTNGTFYVQHYLPPVNLRGMQVLNSAGQVILVKNYNGNASSLIPVNLQGMAGGVYTVRLLYAGKVITQRIVKFNN